MASSGHTSFNLANVTQWTFGCATAVYHVIAPTRGKCVPTDFLGGVKPQMWLSDRLRLDRTTVAQPLWHAPVCAAFRHACNMGLSCRSGWPPHTFSNLIVTPKARHRYVRENPSICRIAGLNFHGGMGCTHMSVIGEILAMCFAIGIAGVGAFAVTTYAMSNDWL
jgi:hypothetical protein